MDSHFFTFSLISNINSSSCFAAHAPTGDIQENWEAVWDRLKLTALLIKLCMHVCMHVCTVELL